MVETDRGGKSTFHGPGPARLLSDPRPEPARPGRPQVLPGPGGGGHPHGRALRLEATRIEGLTGVWLERPPRKIASIGVHISRWVTTHGYALNVDLDPAPFTDWITACGLEDAAFTTIARELGRPVTVDEVRPQAAAAIAEVFGLELGEPAVAVGDASPACERGGTRSSSTYSIPFRGRPRRPTARTTEGPSPAPSTAWAVPGGQWK